MIINDNLEKICIFGSGGFAREVLQIIEDINTYLKNSKKYEIVGFLDGNADNHGKIVNGYSVLGDLNWLETQNEISVIIAIGNPISKRKIATEIKSFKNVRFPTLIHPKAIIGDYNSIGEGTIICAGTILTNNITINDHVILNLACTVGHDTVIESYTTVAPGVNISGNVKIAEGCDLGTNSVIIQGKSIGQGTIIGAGGVVVKDIPENVTAVGNPVKVIKVRENHWQLS